MPANTLDELLNWSRAVRAEATEARLRAQSLHLRAVEAHLRAQSLHLRAIEARHYAQETREWVQALTLELQARVEHGGTMLKDPPRKGGRDGREFSQP